MTTSSRLPHHLGGAVLAVAIAAAFSPALAQTPPDAGSLLRQIEQQRQLPPPPPAPARVAPALLQPPPGAATVRVQRFAFAGNTLLASERLAPAVAEFLNRPLAFADLQRAAVAVAEAYRAAGWVVRTYLPQQDITGGTVTIQVVEAVFGAVRIDGRPRRVGEAQLKRLVETAQRPGTPLNGDALDRALLLIDDLPGLSVHGSLTEGRQQAETDLLLTVQDGALLGGDVTADNTGSRSTGATRVAANVSLNSPTGRADLAQATLMHTQGSDYLRTAYSLPIGDRGWRLGANLSHLSYRLLTADLAAADAHGTSTTAGLEATFPWLRTRTANVYLSISAESKRFDNQSGGTTSTRYKTTTATIGLSGHRFDEFAGGGSTAGNLGFTTGRVDLKGSPNEAADAASTRTAGGFGKLRYGISRQQVITGPWQFFVAFNGQIASKNLDSSEKFYLGGASGVRAYPSSEGGGSEGQLLTMELRTRLGETVSLAGFVDHGRVRVNRDNDIPGATALNTYALKGTGVTASWLTPVGMTVKATLARRVGHNPNPTAAGLDQDGTLKKNRIWLQASLPF